jgi:hypothetical protein
MVRHGYGPERLYSLSRKALLKAILAGRMKGGQDWSRVEEERFEVVAVTLFGKIVVARYATLEQAEWRARELGEEAERNPRGYVQYLARPVERPAGER